MVSVRVKFNDDGTECLVNPESVIFVDATRADGERVADPQVAGRSVTILKFESEA